VAELQKKADDLKAKPLPDAADAAKAQAEAAATAQKDAKAAAEHSLYTVERFVEPSRGSEDFAKQVITTISTLVVSISAFYFGSTTAISAAKAAAVTPTATPSAPVITKDPANLERHAGESAEFTVTATGSDLTYQWQQQKVKDAAATDIPGEKTDTYRIAKVTPDDNGTKFSCRVTNPAGTVISKVATLTVA
jgi:Immunoglobulin I-set domain